MVSPGPEARRWGVTDWLWALVCGGLLLLLLPLAGFALAIFLHVPSGWGALIAAIAVLVVLWRSRTLLWLLAGGSSLAAFTATMRLSGWDIEGSLDVGGGLQAFVFGVAVVSGVFALTLGFGLFATAHARDDRGRAARSRAWGERIGGLAISIFGAFWLLGIAFL